VEFEGVEFGEKAGADVGEVEEVAEAGEGERSGTSKMEERDVGIVVVVDVGMEFGDVFVE
jgi:hypothetical protein